MKRTVLWLACAALLCSLPRDAAALGVVDTSSASKYYIGVKAGLVLSTYWGPGRINEGTLLESVANTLLMGVTAGVNLPIVVREHFTVEPELLFTTRGCQWADDSVDLEDVQMTVYRRVNYLDLPVLFKLVLLNREARIRPIIYAAPQLSFCVRSYTKYKGEGVRRQYSTADSTYAFDLEGAVGLGAQIRAGRGFFIIDIRGNLGMLDVCSKGLLYRNWYGTGSVGYCFNPKRKKTLW